MQAGRTMQLPPLFYLSLFGTVADFYQVAAYHLLVTSYHCLLLTAYCLLLATY